eukprot:jgi/Picsp_1/3544/NSC_06382-R1_mcb2 protein
MSVTHAVPDPLPTGTSREREPLQLCEAREQGAEKQETGGKGRSTHGSNLCLLQVVRAKEKKSGDEITATAPASTRNMRTSGRSIHAMDQIPIPMMGALSGRKVSRQAASRFVASHGSHGRSPMAGVSWNEAEHLAFLKGLQVFGKGQWKQISRYYVPTRTPTQVASHAQKHFLRLAGNTKRRSKFTDVERGLISSALRGQQVSEQHSGSSAGDQHQMLARSGIQQEDKLVPWGLKDGQPGQLLVGLQSRMGVPPVDSTGMALGIPLPEIPALEAHMPGKIPMLKVLPGRIKAMCTTIRPASPSPSQKMKNDAVEQRKKGGKEEKIANTGQRQGPKRSKKTSSDDSELSDAGVEGASALEALAGIAAALAEEQQML